MEFKASELAAGSARSKEDMIDAAAKLSFDWIITNISSDAVRNVVGD